MQSEILGYLYVFKSVNLALLLSGFLYRSIVIKFCHLLFMENISHSPNEFVCNGFIKLDWYMITILLLHILIFLCCLNKVVLWLFANACIEGWALVVFINISNQIKFILRSSMWTSRSIHYNSLSFYDGCIKSLFQYK